MMQECISPEEVIKLALQIEQSGKAIYENAMLQTQIPELTELFQSLAKDENDHIDTFQKIYDDFKIGGDDLEVTKPEDIFYLENLAKNQIFQGKDKAINSIKDAAEPLQLVNLALSFERDTMLFFMKLYRMMCAKYREKISRLIKEEESHIAKLTEIQYRLKTPKPNPGVFGKE
jgi:rubrerythrin